MVRRLKKLAGYTLAYAKGFVLFVADLWLFKKELKRSKFNNTKLHLYPRLLERTVETNFDGHYVYHTAWAARCLRDINPKVHVDISSSLYFCSIASAFIPVDFYDYRPARLKLSSLSSNFVDLLNLDFKDGSLESISCMHVIEHLGLGRYGDEVNVTSHLTAIAELKRVVKPGGSILFVVPVGREKIYFNAHRVFSVKTILNIFSDYKLEKFSYLPDTYLDSGLIENPTEDFCAENEYGCGMFWFKK